MAKSNDPAALEEIKAAVIVAQAALSEHDDLVRLDRLIAAKERLAALIPEDEAEHGIAVMDIASLLGTRWARTRDVQTWSRAIQLIEYWTARVPTPDWRAALYLLAHGLLRYRRADATEESDDVRAAIAALEAARAAVRPGSGVQGTASTYLANLRLRRFEAELQPVDLEAALHDALAVVGSDRAMDLERYHAARTLTRVLYLRFDELGFVEDLDAAVDAAEYAIGLAPTPEDMGDIQGALASALRQRFGQRHQPSDLDRAIKAYQHSLQTASGDPKVTASRLDNLGNGFGSRYELHGAAVDLDNAIACSRRALELFPADRPERGRIYANLGLSLMAVARDRKQTQALEEAVNTFRIGLQIANLEPDVVTRLHAGLGEALLVRSALDRNEDDLDAAIDVLESGLANALLGEADLPVGYRLGHRGHASILARRLVGALLKRARGGGKRSQKAATADRRRALAVGESGKVVLLTQELLRRSLARPDNLDPGLTEWEAQLLARLAALDSHELAPSYSTSTGRRLHRMAQRHQVTLALQNVWDEMVAAEPSARAYVALRRELPAALLDVLASRPRHIALLSMLEIELVHADGRFRPGLCALAWWPEATDPEVLMDLDDDPVPTAVERFAVEVPADLGREEVPETWWQDLARHIPARVFDRDVIIAVSPSDHGSNLPWSLVLERSGWVDTRGHTLPVVVVPSLVLTVLTVPSEPAWHEIPNVAERLGIAVDLDVADSVRVTRRMSTTPNAPPVVVGNPTSDLPSASKEAVEVAKILGVQPLLGQQATVDTVAASLADSALIHLAAHAEFDGEAPLESKMHLADGDLPARRLIGAWSAAHMVILSACEAGSGALAAGGELLGFATTLLRAGVRAVVVSLWRVDDAATAYLMIRFHELMSNGLTPVRALVEAQALARAQPGWDAPYYWAGFFISERGVNGARKPVISG